MVRLALLSALSDRAANNRVALVDEWGWDGPKTKDAVATLRNLKITGTVLVVLADDETIAGRSFANLPNAHTTSFGQLSAHDVLRSDWVLFSDRTLPGSAEPGGRGSERAGSGGGGGRRRDRQRHGDPDRGRRPRPSRRRRETEEAATDA